MSSLGTSLLYLFLLVPMFLLLVGALRGFGAQPRRADWLVRSMVLGVVGAVTSGVLVKLLVFTDYDEPDELWHPLITLRFLHMVFDPFVQVLVCGGFLALAARWLGSPRYVLGAVVVFLAWESVFFGVYQLPAYAHKVRPQLDHVPQVRQFIQSRWESAARPVVYWPAGQVEYLWFDLRVCSWFTGEQFVGSLFSRPMVFEGLRRARLVERFDDRWVLRRVLQRELAADGKREPPRQSDLERLCQEEVDFVVLRQRFGNLFSETTGTWYLYDCRQVRAALAMKNEERGTKNEE